MVWFKFETDYDFTPAATGYRSTVAYKAGMVLQVTRECADKAEAAGAGKRTTKPKPVKNAEPEADDADAGRG